MKSVPNMHRHKNGWQLIRFSIIKIYINASANILPHKTKKNEIRAEIVKKCIENELRISKS